MYIIDRNKDYYDYLSHIYGLDKSIVFDRRGSHIIDDGTLYGIVRGYQNVLLLEIGYVQYLLHLEDIIIEKSIFGDEFKSCTIKVLHTYIDNNHYFDEPISIRNACVDWRWNFYKKGFPSNLIIANNFKNTVKRIDDNIIGIPILKNTQITSLISPEDVWKELNTYISSLHNDKDIKSDLTDVEKAINHGFDKKTSFRNPIK